MENVWAVKDILNTCNFLPLIFTDRADDFSIGYSVKTNLRRIDMDA